MKCWFFDRRRWDGRSGGESGFAVVEEHGVVSLRGVVGLGWSGGWMAALHIPAGGQT